MSDIALSVVVVAYEMRRELPRTIRSLSPLMQRGVSAGEYEIIVVDNGSRRPCKELDCPGFGARLRFERVAHPTVAPAPAVNLGLSVARGKLLGVFIDGARMASPGLLAGALQGARLFARPVVASLGFHLGPRVQRESVRNGYDAAAEDRLLESVSWTEDGYRLFSISAPAGSSMGGYFAPIAESNGLFMPRDLWAELGGYDEAFVQPGGGLVNLDTYRRACLLTGARLVVLMGEGTFHQVHGGVATNSLNPDYGGFYEEYERLRGERFSAPRNEPVFLGTVRREVLPELARSASYEHAAEWDTVTE